jgi:methanethiol S-methyltransferase
MLRRITYFVYGVTGHLLFLATYAWLAGFVGNVLVPRSVDSHATGSVPLSIAIDAGLIVLFGLQHSVMARPAFKRVWTRIVPRPIERSTYVFASCAATALLMWQWRAVEFVVWDARHPALRAMLYGMFAFGWLMVPAVSLMINHFDLFGTRQVWLFLRGREYEPLPFRTPLLYARVRHPLYIGWAIAFWATPTMTAGHLLLAAGMTAYMLLAVVFEERDLISHFGRQYEEYRRFVPMFVPWRTPAVDGRVLSDPSWLHWVVTVPLLAGHLAGLAWALPATMALCAVMAGYYIIQLRAVKPFPVQVRLAYLVLLAVGTLPWMGWVHWLQIAGTTAMVVTGYCLLARALCLLPFNRDEPMSASLVRRILLAPVVGGGLLRWSASPAAGAHGSCSSRASCCGAPTTAI